MALRQRLIYEGIWSDEAVMSLPVEARLLYIGTISIADDWGRFKAGTRQLKAQVFPADSFTAEQVGEWFALLVRENLIIPYEIDGASCAVHPNWFRYQGRTFSRLCSSTIPSPPKSLGLDDRLYGLPNGVTPEELRRNWPSRSKPPVSHSESQCVTVTPDQHLESRVEESRGEDGTEQLPPVSPKGETVRKGPKDRVEASPHLTYLTNLGRWFYSLPAPVVPEAEGSPGWWAGLDACRLILEVQMAKIPSPNGTTEPTDRLRKLLKFAVEDDPAVTGREFGWKLQIRSLASLAVAKRNGLPKWANVEAAAHAGHKETGNERGDRIFAEIERRREERLAQAK